MNFKAQQARLRAKLAAIRGDTISWVDHPSRGMLVEGHIHGVLPNKSNSRKIVQVKTMHGMLTRVIKEKGADEFVDKVYVAAAEWRMRNKPLDGKLEAIVVVHQADLRRDLDAELLYDALQKAGVVKNDRAFWHKNIWREVDRDNPRVHFEIWERQEGDEQLFGRRGK